jgi:hypothetical protein
MVGENEKYDYGSPKIREIKMLIVFDVKRRPGASIVDAKTATKITVTC